MSSVRKMRRENARKRLQEGERQVLLSRYIERYGAVPVSQADNRSRARKIADRLREWLPVALEIGRALFPTIARLFRRGA
jgi:hypothetical protein